MKKIPYILFAIILSSCGKPSAQEEVQIPQTHTVAVRLMSFNIRYNTSSDKGDNSWAVRKEACYSMIDDTAPDIIGLQEPRPAQAADILDALPAYSHHVIETSDPGVSNTVVQPSTGKQADADAKTGYTLILYRTNRFTLEDSGYFWLGETPEKACLPFEASDDEVRTCIWVKLKEKESGKSIFFFDTHAPYKNDATDNSARRKCFALCVSKMKEIAGYDVPLAIVGDMNASWSLNDSRRTALEPFYQWMYAARGDGEDYGVYRGHTYSSDYYDTPRPYSFNNFGLSTPGTTWNIDHIFYRNMAPVRFRTVTDADYGVTYISDHYPIIFDAKI